MLDVLSTMLRTGILTEPSPVCAEAPVAVATLQKDLWNIVGRCALRPSRRCWLVQWVRA